MLGEIFEDTIFEEFFNPQENLQKSEENMLAKDNGESITNTLWCRHSSVVKHLIKQFVDNFNLNVFKEKKVAKF